VLTPGSKFRFERALQQPFVNMGSLEKPAQILPIGIYVVRRIEVLHNEKSFEVWKSIGRKVRQGSLGRQYLPTRYVLVEITPTILQDTATVLHSVAPGVHWQRIRGAMIRACQDLEGGADRNEVLCDLRHCWR
jgi:hypothetical protein